MRVEGPEQPKCLVPNSTSSPPSPICNLQTSTSYFGRADASPMLWTHNKLHYFCERFCWAQQQTPHPREREREMPRIRDAEAPWEGCRILTWDTGRHYSMHTATNQDFPPMGMTKPMAVAAMASRRLQQKRYPSIDLAWLRPHN